MSILAVGSVAYDSVKTPHGSRQSVLGGSATYFSVAASCFSQVSVVAVVGRLHSLTEFEIRNRYREFRELTYFHGAENADLPTRVKGTPAG